MHLYAIKGKSMKDLPKILINLDTSEIWGRSLTLGIVKYATVHGPWMFYRQSPYYLTKKPVKLIDWVKKYRPDGIFMLEPNRREEEELAQIGIPTIVSGYTQEFYSSFANIITDHKAIGKMAAEHLLDRGFESFAFCGYDTFWSKQRCRGFSERIANAGFETEIYKVPSTAKKRSWECEQFTVADWLRSLKKPAGLMACIDNRGLEIVEACKIANLRIPIDVAVIGVNDDKLLCSLSPQPLSSVAINSEQTGYDAAELMDKMIKGKLKMAGRTKIVYPTHIAARQSTDILAIDDKAIADAVHYIRINPKDILQVDDIARACKLSKRTLQRRFKNALGYSVHKEINNVRTEYIAQLLRDTNMSISQIAITTGYTGSEHISRLLQKAKGMNASQYRKQFNRK
jgi:LacI family transcriptional regulator